MLLKKAEYPLSPKRSKRLMVHKHSSVVRHKDFGCSVDSLPIHFFVRLSRNVLTMEVSTISELMINEQIRDREVRLIGSSGEQLGIMSARDALQKAKEEELDLVKVSPNAKPPVCKIIDYGKYRYELARKEKENKKKQKVVEIKEIRMSPNIDSNDLTTKMNAARKFLEKGNKVKVTLRFRGREMAHVNTSSHMLTDFAEGLQDIAVMEKNPKMEGRSISMVLSQKKN